MDRTCVVVMALCKQPQAFALDLGDDQSRYLYVRVHRIAHDFENVLLFV